MNADPGLLEHPQPPTSTRRGLLLVVSAASGTGKTSLVTALTAQLPDIRCSISHTTRARRPGEVDGVHYHFIDSSRFEQMVAAGAFLEHATVFDHHYGTTRAEVEAHWAAGRDVILEIDWQGARQVRASHPSTRSLFILPPSLTELQSRLSQRPGSSDREVTRRMRDAVAEMQHHAEYDYLLVNDDFQTALEGFVAIVRAERLTVQRQLSQLSTHLAGLLSAG
ncbi:MAG TPA: guanylate kinase [Gammaproteobacteria bacterium]|nr:guanylate kinase [Gammaproteobacteria bacterium]